MHQYFYLVEGNIDIFIIVEYHFQVFHILTLVLLYQLDFRWQGNTIPRLALLHSSSNDEGIFTKHSIKEIDVLFIIGRAETLCLYFAIMRIFISTGTEMPSIHPSDEYCHIVN